MKTPGPFQKSTSPLVGLRAHVEKQWSSGGQQHFVWSQTDTLTITTSISQALMSGHYIVR